MLFLSDVNLLQKQMQDSIKSKSKMEIQLDELLRERAENEDELIDLREKAKTLESKDMQIAELQREIKAQSSQLDALVAELSNGREVSRTASLATAASSCDDRFSSTLVEEWRKEIFQLQRAMRLIHLQLKYTRLRL